MPDENSVVITYASSMQTLTVTVGLRETRNVSKT